MNSFPKAFMSTLGKHVHLLMVVIPQYQEFYRAKKSVMTSKREMSWIKDILFNNSGWIRHFWPNYNVEPHLKLETSYQHQALCLLLALPHVLVSIPSWALSHPHAPFYSKAVWTVIGTKDLKCSDFLCRLHQNAQKQKQWCLGGHTKLLNSCPKSLTRVRGQIISLSITNKINNPLRE